MHLSVLVLAAYAALSSAAPSSAPHNFAVHEKRDALPSRWTTRDKVPAGAILPVRIGLAQSNLEKGMDYLMDVYVLPCALFLVITISTLILTGGSRRLYR